MEELPPRPQTVIRRPTQDEVEDLILKQSDSLQQWEIFPVHDAWLGIRHGVIMLRIKNTKIRAAFNTQLTISWIDKETAVELQLKIFQFTGDKAASDINFAYNLKITEADDLINLKLPTSLIIEEGEIWRYNPDRDGPTQHGNDNIELLLMLIKSVSEFQ